MATVWCERMCKMGSLKTCIFTIYIYSNTSKNIEQANILLWRWIMQLSALLFVDVRLTL